MKRRFDGAVNLLLLMFVSVGLVAISETVFGCLAGLRPAQEAFPPPREIQQPHAVLGSEITRVDDEYEHWVQKRDGTLLKAVYTIRAGRRVTPVSNPETRDRFMAFFGCSFVLGLGSNDNETIPAYAAELAPSYMPYNLGDPGKSTQTMYWKLKTREYREAIEEEKGIGIYVCPAFHVRRVNVMLPEFAHWTHGLPKFRRADDGLAYVGPLREAHPYLARVYGLLSLSRTLDYFGIYMPLRITERHCNQLVLQVVESQRVFKEQFPDSEFVVFLWESAKYQYVLDILSRRFDQEGVRYITMPPQYVQEIGRSHTLQELAFTCGHPRPLLNEIVARYIVNELGAHGALNADSVAP